MSACTDNDIQNKSQNYHRGVHITRKRVTRNSLCQKMTERCTELSTHRFKTTFFYKNTT